MDKMTIFDTIEGDDAAKLMFFFTEELNTDADRNGFKLELTRIDDAPIIQIIGRESNRKVSLAVVERWKSLLSDKLYDETINGNSENTMGNVLALINACKLKVKVLPIQSKAKNNVVRIYSKRSVDLCNVRHAYENPQNPMTETLSRFPDATVRPKSRQMARHEDKHTGSFKQVDLDVKFEFSTTEGLRVKLYKTGITRLNVDAIVNAANDRLENVGGVAEVIAKAAGDQMQRECKDIVRKKRIIWEGTNVVTSAGNMNNYKGVIHAVGPRWYDHPDKSRCLQILKDTIIHILETAERNGYTSVAMPPISSGIFGVPKKLCAAIYLSGIFTFSRNGHLGSVKEFHIIDIHDDVLDMVHDWYQKWKLNDPRCLDISSLLEKTYDPGYPDFNKSNREKNHSYNYDKDNKDVRVSSGSYGKTREWDGERNKKLKQLKVTANLLPIKSKEKDSIVRVFGRREEDIDMLRRASESPDPLGESVGANGLPTGGQVHLRSVRTGQNQRASGSFQSYSPKTKLEFDTHKGLHVKVYKDAITKLKVDAIVNAANDNLANIGGVALVISKAAGRDMDSECKEKIKKHGRYGIPDGDNEVTGAGRLPYKGIIHAVGPRWHAYTDKRECLRTLQKTIVNILEAGKRKNFTTIAMPPISSCIFGVPKKLCAASYLSGIFTFSRNGHLGSVKEFHIIDIHDDVLDMVHDWYQKWKLNDPRCLDISSLLEKTYDPGYPDFNKSNREKNHSYNYDKDNKDVRVSSGSYGKTREWDGERNRELKQDVFKSMHGNTDIHINTGNILHLKDVDAVVVDESPSFSGEGELARTLLKNADDAYRNKHDELKRRFYNFNYRMGQVIMTDAGSKLPFKRVYHVIISRIPNDCDEFYPKQLKSAIGNVLSNADSLPGRTTKTMSLALPMIGTGDLIDQSLLQACCYAASVEIWQYLKIHKYTKLRHIHLVNVDEMFTYMLREIFTRLAIRGPPPTRNQAIPRVVPRDYETQTKGLKQIDTWKMEKTTNASLNVSNYFLQIGSKSKAIAKKGNISIFGDDEEGDVTTDDSCVICLCDMTCPVQLKVCKHTFCKECISELFQTKPSCPVCSTVYGKMYGDQPRDGKAYIYVEPMSLPGYNGTDSNLLDYI